MMLRYIATLLSLQKWQWHASWHDIFTATYVGMGLCRVQQCCPMSLYTPCLCTLSASMSIQSSPHSFWFPFPEEIFKVTCTNWCFPSSSYFLLTHIDQSHFYHCRECVGCMCMQSSISGMSLHLAASTTTWLSLSQWCHCCVQCLLWHRYSCHDQQTVQWI